MNSPIPLDCLWAIEPQTMRQVEAAVAAYGPEALRVPAGWSAPSPMEVIDGVAVIGISGPMTKRSSLFTALFNASSTQAVQEAVEAAAADPQVKAILLDVDSPGGSVDGLAELVDAVWGVRGRKPIVAQVSGLGASAAYMVASQADAVYAGRMDLVGSIGTRLMLYDFSRLFANAGIEAVPIATGPYKTAGALGTEITADQRAYFQGIVDQYLADFLAAVSRGRKLAGPALEAVADGRVFLAETARQLGLVDGIQTKQQTLARLAAAPGKSLLTRRNAMSETQTPASYAELKASLPGAPPEFLCQQLERGATLDQAKSAWMEAMAAENARLKQDREAEQRAAAEAKRIAAAGVAPALTVIGTATEGGVDDPVAEFSRRTAEAMKSRGLTRQQAAVAVAKADKELHKQYLLATQSSPKARALVEQNY